MPSIPDAGLQPETESHFGDRGVRTTPILAHAQRITPAEGLAEDELERIRATLRRRASLTPGHLRVFTPAPDFPEIDLSLWRSPLSVRAYIQAGRPALVDLRRGSNPARFAVERVMWWLTEDCEPHAAEAAARLEHLRHHGPGPEGFTVRSPVPAPDLAGR